MDATTDELKALGHPVRWRILRLCLDRAMTNKQLSVWLDLAPATTLRHIRALVKTNFLAAEPVRTGDHGALERPYRATSRTRGLSILHDDTGLAHQVDLAVLAAHRAEMIAAGNDAGRGATRGVLRLRPHSIESLNHRIRELIAEYPDEPDGEPLSYLWSLAARPPQPPEDP
ncbi:ArsR/SmtB family transcription factor [Actinocrispum wychmicini]|uniref:Helix-turn-helix protein n=1 Tax=Actinocrispum wychmicini TaxID=1213861 RepID=A0A4R2JS52_9PSEU|nr:winged helix-turn-helix domain-containing protein [Actinocrispum wychmicini]TCO59699.1 helix-turn-helix protein [Actinocrispum wychmicini]